MIALASIGVITVSSSFAVRTRNAHGQDPQPLLQLPMENRFHGSGMRKCQPRSNLIYVTDCLPRIFSKARSLPISDEIAELNRRLESSNPYSASLTSISVARH